MPISAAADGLADVLRRLPPGWPEFARLVELAAGVVGNGGTILVAGNGGSAAMAQHFAAELVVRFRRSRRAWPAVALCTDGAVLTAAGNDIGFEWIFARQVAALGHLGDLLLVLSTSGNSPNILHTIDAAAALRMDVAGLTGADGGKLAGLARPLLRVPSTDTARIQEVHLLILHALAEALDGMGG